MLQSLRLKRCRYSATFFYNPPTTTLFETVLKRGDYAKYYNIQHNTALDPWILQYSANDIASSKFSNAWYNGGILLRGLLLANEGGA